MEKRIDKIFGYLEDNTSQLTREQLLGNQGFEAGKMAECLGILRNNVSKELNELFRQDKIIKLKGRPVKYLDKAGVEKILGVQFRTRCVEVDDLHAILAKPEEEDPFQDLIGAGKSLRNQVEQAKAAIIYPPSGLHTLIVGQTGVGKTLFAKMMYNYGAHIKRFAAGAPFVIFNCADYYNNPQLLLAHIFGFVKGAFTGADRETSGLVEKADGGILFLDEIHRLPPEGQEMIFYFMDTGAYNKLGETERKRKANVLIMGATTEDPASYFLQTFLRRIPMVIRIPSLQERTVEEQIDIIKYLFANEAHRLSKSIRIPQEVVKALIGSVSYGNIGQLKSNVQLICAKGFLDSRSSGKDLIELDFKVLPSGIKEGLFELKKNRQEFEKICSFLDTYLVINPEGYRTYIEDSSESSFNLYQLIEDKIGLLQDEGLDEDYINQFITTDIHIHLKQFYNKINRGKENRKRILKIIDREILEFAESVKCLAEKELNRQYSERFVYALSFHLSAFFKRIKEKKYNNRTPIEDSIQKDDLEFRVALQIRALIRSTFSVEVPAVEVTYLALLLKSVQEERSGQVGILVAAHGNSTASSMVNVVEKLLGEANVCAVDMPLDVSPREILEVIIVKVKGMDKGKGVLLLVDMGSLFNFEATVVERTGSQVRTIDMVSTPLVLEAVRKSSVFNMELDEIYHSLAEFRGYHNGFKEQNSSNKVIITVCSSGKGSAIRLSELVGKIIWNGVGPDIPIIPTGIRELDQKIKELQKNHEVLAVVGVKRPKENIAFIPIEKLIDGSGEKILQELVAGRQVSALPQSQSTVAYELCEDNLKQFLVYLNPHKVVGILFNFVQELARDLDMEVDNALRIRLVLHLGYALERMMISEGLEHKRDKSEYPPHIVSAVHHGCELFERSLHISLTEDEQYYICDMLV